ncbi:DUF1127 domain-containing protein [Lichenifustis flavocetrariae]|uniref:DUF1127 domain-containing protein n=1 Tax=Lichenifustis flavocetrariae TaxID=2949735 RepID=A0AA42CJV5_9HYPH|nr:DUF1127 domain-containing protein [Lichenifustis flavocetrariae]MCW6508506.1 DUF1127 domain-containing protein [Lichenifustis flavocetrariae]
MPLSLTRWLLSEWRLHQERQLVRRLLLLDDHLLKDLGLRREQLQPDGIHQVDVAPATAVWRARHQTRAGMTRTSLQGCG